jgi:hypothetical protein
MNVAKGATMDHNDEILADLAKDEPLMEGFRYQHLSLEAMLIAEPYAELAVRLMELPVERRNRSIMYLLMSRGKALVE